MVTRVYLGSCLTLSIHFDMDGKKKVRAERKHTDGTEGRAASTDGNRLSIREGTARQEEKVEH